MNPKLYAVLDGLEPARSAAELWGGLPDSIEHIRTAFLFFNFRIRDWTEPNVEQRQWLEQNRQFLAEPFDW